MSDCTPLNSSKQTVIAMAGRLCLIETCAAFVSPRPSRVVSSTFLSELKIQPKRFSPETEFVDKPRDGFSVTSKPMPRDINGAVSHFWQSAKR